MTYYKKIFKRLQDVFSPQSLVYICGLVFVMLVPIVNGLFLKVSRYSSEIEWEMVLDHWLSMIPFVVMFVVHAKILMPLILVKQRLALYAITTLILIVSCVIVSDIMWSGPRGGEHQRQMVERDREMINGADNEERLPPDNRRVDNRRKPHAEIPDDPNMLLMFGIFHGPWISKVFIAIMLVCFNIAVELFFRSQRDKKALAELKYNEMQAELDYLKYQINPHFFMNTLNNIHALVDIDSEKAKHTIVELSKLMRYLLYESDKKTILLQKEIQFLKHYVELMMIRYPEDRLKVEVDMPDDMADIMIPPLLFVCFVENAFKHGVSFREESYVDIRLRVVDNNVTFQCRNSNVSSNQQDQHHGIGLDNIRKRLELLYPEKHVLQIDKNDKEFSVLVVVPVG